MLTDLVRGGDWRITRRNRAHPGRHRAPGATEPATAADRQAWPASSGQGQIAAGQRTRTGRALYDDLVAAELADGCRVVAADEHWIAFVPAAARWPFEVHVPPRVRVPDLLALGEAARDAFGPLYLDVLRRLDGLFGVRMPYVAAWHQASVRSACLSRPLSAGTELCTGSAGLRRPG